MTTATTRIAFWPDGSAWLKRLTQSDAAPTYLALLLFVTYGLAPLVVALQLEAAEHFVRLAIISSAAALFVWIGSRLSFADRLIEGRMAPFVVHPGVFVGSIWLAFVLFVFIAWTTAEELPLVAAVRGADAETVAVLREQFLKAREGWQASFVYINAILAGALIPFSIALLFLYRLPGRWLAFGFFLIYCISFVEKAFFLKAALPLLYLVAQRRVRIPVSPGALLLGMLGLLFTVTVLSGAGTAEGDDDVFFSVSYVPQGPLQHLIWRSVAIPMVTAADALRVLNDEFGGRYFLGATSSFLAAIFGQERVEFERLVFAAQWGQLETGTGSSNSVYLTEAYVNFGWPGVVAFSLVIGLLMRLMARSVSESVRALWPLFVLGVYTSGLIGLMLSNGFAVFFALAVLVRFRLSRQRRSG